ETARRTEEAGVAEAEDPTVAGGHPVAPARGRRGDAHHRLVERDPGERSPVHGAAEGVDRSVGAGQPVAIGGSGGGQAAQYRRNDGGYEQESSDASGRGHGTGRTVPR